MTIDLEVENHPYCGSKASPYCPDNYVVHSAYRIDRTHDDGTVTVEPTFDIRFNSKQEFLDDVAGEHLWFRIPSDCWLLVAHNAAFEISWFLTYQRQHFEEFLKRGGRVFDTMHGHYIASDFQDLYPSLDETAPKYGGEHKIDGVKLLWEQGALTSEIDPILLRDYLVNGDVPNTALCFYGECSIFAERGQMQMVWERMDAMLAWAYCEFYGLYVNMPVAQRNQAEQEQRIQELRQQLQQYLPKDLPEEFEFNYGSNYHMSALVYGGPIRYDMKVPYDPPKFVKVEVQDGVYKAGKNKGLPKFIKVDSDVPLLKWGKGIYNFPGIVNIQELPQHLQEKYSERGEFRGAQTLPDGSPVYSTSGDAMNGLAAQGFEFAKLVNELAALEKDTGTYYLRTEYNKDGSVKKVSGMLQYVIPDNANGSGIIHHRLNTCSTVTGRLSASNPNLQNLPRDGTSRVKQMFTSRFGEQGRITEVDYSALEVVMSCVHTGDLKLLELLQKDTDMHCYRLAFKEGKSYEEMYQLCHDASGPDYKYWKQQRTDIKPPSFAAQYGATAKGIAFATGCTVEYAQSFLDNEAKLFPTTIGFRDVVRAEVERTGMLEPVLREQSEDGQWRLYRRGYWTSPAGTRYSFRQKLQWQVPEGGGRKVQVMDYKGTEIANYWNQGEAFFLMAVAAGQVLRRLIQKDWYGGKVVLVTNVHDALYLDSADEETAVLAGNLVKDAMEEAPRRIAALWPNYGIISQVPFPAAAEHGKSMYDKQHTPTVEEYYAAQ
ncbi:DNA polymerase [Enterobacter phage SDFMU_Pec]|uniref:DNA polymerase n=1 Tax=Enterobacter phage SDFMU_Pec TaxID=3076136 RepID=A0AA96KQW0_9CAUD|nr:DNA polymerase [Enterobacter phage SDFMU_Pec]